MASHTHMKLLQMYHLVDVRNSHLKPHLFKPAQREPLEKTHNPTSGTFAISGGWHLSGPALWCSLCGSLGQSFDQASSRGRNRGWWLGDKVFSCVFLFLLQKLGNVFLHFDSVMGWLLWLSMWVSAGKLCVTLSMTNLTTIFVVIYSGEGWSGCHEEGLGAMSQRYITLPGLMARPETGECVETTPNQQVLLSHFFSREAIWQKKVSWNWCCYIFRKAFPSKFQAFHEFWDFDGVVCFSCLIQVWQMFQSSPCWFGLEGFQFRKNSRFLEFWGGIKGLLWGLQSSLLLNQKLIPHGTTQPWRICGLCFCIRYPSKLTLEEFFWETIRLCINIYAYISWLSS